MDFFSIFVIALSLSADCFAVALGGSISMGRTSLVQALRVAFAFGFFQALMPTLGWIGGRSVYQLIASWDHWVAFILLLGVGGKMVWESLLPSERRTEGTDISRGWLLLTLAVATSIDAFAVGLSFAFLQVDIVLANATIGLVAFTIAAAGFLLGKKAGKLAGRRAGLIGGIILVGIGFRVLLAHLL